MNTPDTFDCAVIGGGPAGASSACYLRRAGRSVVLFEQNERPEDKVCGEFLSREALEYLDHLGVDLSGEKNIVISDLILRSPHYSSRVKLPLKARVLPRRRLDEILLKKAGEAGTEIYRGYRVHDYRRENGGFVLATQKGEFRARNIFLATGKHNLRRHARKGEGPFLIGIKMHLSLPPEMYSEVRGRILMYFYPGGYGGVVPLGDSEVNLCFLITKEVYKSLEGGLEGVFDYLRMMNSHLGRILDETRLISPIRSITNIPYGFFYPDTRQEEAALGASGKVLMVGDQFAVIPSLTGNGIALALMTGKMKARAFLRNGEQPRSDTEEWPSALRRQIRLACRVHHFFLNPFLFEAGVLFAGFFPMLVKLIFQRTRMKVYEY